MSMQKLIAAWAQCSEAEKEQFYTLVKQARREERIGKRKQKAKIPVELRWQVWERDGHKCVYCGSKKFLAVDHVIAESVGGETVLGNLITACNTCNRKKGSMHYLDFIFSKQFPGHKR